MHNEPVLHSNTWLTQEMDQNTTLVRNPSLAMHANDPILPEEQIAVAVCHTQSTKNRSADCMSQLTA